ncbi:hypothetical protein [Cellulophaga omnivescoria]|uniref:hypothetical protein n=1 Tax=Cellulophaga omnivescoria TaxID=1888890 RepID=UPI0022F00828|nr:hypothetical protein [Cellulophaga omnivescoria]WBU89332.1 hypothetical protein PBN93_15855 [Cellulophaga omnivescoria]
MAYNIRNLRNHNVGDYNYFLDANIWIKKLKPKLGHINKKDKTYSDLFDKIVECHNSKIFITPLLISEILNVCLHIDFQNFLTDIKKSFSNKKEEKHYMKFNYRPSQEYRDSYLNLLDDISAFEHKLHSAEDSFNKVNLSNLLAFPEKLDFNDFYYQNIFNNTSIKFITDDEDFCVQNIDVFSLNQRLIDAGNKYVIKK